MKLPLKAGQFAHVSVWEKGIDVSVKVTSPTGRLLGWYDGGKDGRRHDPLSAVTLFAQESGDHWVDIHPMDRSPGSRGHYTARVERLESAAGTPAGRAEQWLSPWNVPGMPGVAVGVSRSGEPVFLRGSGAAVVEHGVPITPQTVFHVASVTKQVVAFAIHLLAERGEVSLDGDVRSYLPWVPDFGSPVTLRHLLHHTHGLPGQYFRLMLAGWHGHDVLLQRHVMDLVRGQDALYFEPGAEFMYTNTGYELLVEVVEAVTGQTIREWAQANLFRPLGMTRTLFRDDLHELIPGAAGAYAVDAERGVLREPADNMLMLGGMGLNTTVEDLLKWVHNLDTGTVGGTAVRDRMRERGRLNDGTVLPYASGLEVFESPYGPVLAHGGNYFTTSLVVLLPEKDLAVVTVSNRDNFDRATLARRMAELFLGDTVAGNLSYAEMERHRGFPGAGDPAAGEPNPERLDDYIGVYALPDARLEVFRAGDRLWMQERGEDYITALRLAGDTASMVMPAEEVRLLFERDPSGAVISLRELVPDRRGERAPKVEPFVATPAELAEYGGSYRSDALVSTWTFVVQDGGLVARHRRLEDVRLEPVARDRFRGSAFFFRDVGFVRDPGGAIIAVEVSSERVRRERFERLPAVSPGDRR